jgi:phosphatidylinositol glycan class T
MRAVLYMSVFVSVLMQPVFSVTSAPQKDYFDEELLLKPLPSGHVYAYFQFTTIWDIESEDASCKLK